MQRKKVAVFVFLILLGTVFLFPYTSSAVPSKPTLKQGMSGTYVKNLQYDLKLLGFFNMTPTGYFGKITKASVINFQKKYNLAPDGIVGNKTYYVINKLLGRLNPAISSRNTLINRNLLIPWYGKAENILYIGAKAKVIDVKTKMSFYIKRSYGYNHADVETLTSKDTAVMKKIFDGNFSWERRAIILVVNGRTIAASMAGMPHAGREDLQGDIWVTDWRTGGYGPGYNLDKIKGNNMSGHFDIHFLGSKTHGTDKIDDAHQTMIYKAAQSGY